MHARPERSAYQSIYPVLSNKLSASQIRISDDVTPE